MKHPLEGTRLSAELPEEPLCCIVKFRDDLFFGRDIPQQPCLHVQVTVRKDKVSPSGRFIRFGETSGDELVGWMRRDYIDVIEVLGQTNLATNEVKPFAEAA